jgi:DNA-binding response OmpR family regulator
MSKILLVEDEELLREAYGTILESEGLDVDLAKNGEEALKHWKSKQYDLILLDLMMPKLDGIGFLKKANIKKKLPVTKVVVFTNLSSGGNIKEALELGADEYVLKSNLSPKDLIKTVHAVL